MSVLTLPQARIAIGSAMVNGQRVPVQIDMEWMRYFAALTERAGGVIAPTVTELDAQQYADAGIEENKAQLAALANDLASAPPDYPLMQADDVSSSAADDVAMLSAQIQDLQAVPAAELTPYELLTSEVAELRALVETLITKINDLQQGAL